MRYCLYARKSSESEERQVLSIDSQIKEMLQLAEREGLEVVAMKRESHSAKETGQRPVFNEIVEEIRASKYDGILTWAPDRISRNAGDLGKIVDLMDAGKLKEIRTFSQRFSDNPNEKFLLMILGSQAKLENDNRGINVKRGLRTRVEMGLWPGMAPVGYLNQKHMDKKCQVIIDPERERIVRQMFEKMAYEKWSGRKIYHWLRFDLNFKTVGNHHMALGNLYRMLQNPFYYGTFEYPRGSGNWYQGKHEPIIDKALFDKVQEQLKRDNIQRSSHEFAFTKLMTCGLCGSGISAEEKYKQLKDGTTAKYIYYGCGRSKDRHCKNEYLREEDLVDQLVKLMDRIDLNQLGIQQKFEEELKRFNKFQRGVLGLAGGKATHQDIDLKTYAKYILREGTNEEKRELMGCFRSSINVSAKVITLE
ncbi:MAG: recombinase family protein [Patescibacteria group bacterium]|nr:recombinase family protein [Patescibacteria group bacterium]MDE2057731.1 recombinase family protein [Patescibacteria group bacterium]